MERSAPIFVGGLHRSGTGLLARAIGWHPLVTGMNATGANQDEGQFLQTILPWDNSYGGPGRFAFDPDAHLTETSSFADPANAARLIEQWSPWLDFSQRYWVEKSPANLLRMRLLQSWFPDARFVMIVRHPIAVAAATQKWLYTSPFSRIYHWLHAHEIALADARHVRQVLFVAYEDLMAEPEAEMARIWQFLDLPPDVTPSFEDCNSGYFEQWRQLAGPRLAGHPPHRSIPPTQYPRPDPPRENWRETAKRLLRLDDFRRGRLGPPCDALDAIAAFEPKVRALRYSLEDFTLRPQGKFGE